MLEGTAGRTSELKQQGALEAAADPNSSVTARQAEDTVLHEAKAAGAAAFEFDPDATPEQKQAQLRAVGYEVGGAAPRRRRLTSGTENAGHQAPP